MAEKADRLEEYRRKRARDRTPEPWPDGPPVPGNDTLFVIQEHHATRLHWDFRLERDGVLVSWAVPKGLPLSPGVPRLAVHTEDHPLEYLTFSGEIPAGEYGGGWMTVWDTGTYETLHWNDHKVEVVFHGARTRGKYLFQNRHDEDGRDWTLRRLDPADPGHEDAPEFLEPMTAGPGELPADDDEWAYEFAWGGLRTMLLVCGGRVTAHDGTGADVTDRYPELHKLGEQLGSTEVLLDGEVVVMKDGRPYPAGLDERRRADAAAAKRLKVGCPVFYFASDVLHFDGRPTLELPYTKRRELLDGLGIEDRHWQVPRYFLGGGEAVAGASRQHGLPGVVAKRADSPYRPGGGAGDWVLIEN
ncbi:DNA polymerase ligase N-terminal domain-containing protein [Amycolatopsis sp. Hca4]|uniref:DNA polymerase ligase N-terminal domain-containing protein n=1 Tax=Amycolatopsis sp. Hca4 TaxID=2742131 RepID=UPI00158FDF7B|nr:DNA polymerase ligase N-terminal domain-containing protein [Amycolatopsis sp. Hca4]QKV80834.1 ATP-dependent DNA ligase [Amycolatopsis sp. Hca4]